MVLGDHLTGTDIMSEESRGMMCQLMVYSWEDGPTPRAELIRLDMGTLELKSNYSTQISYKSKSNMKHSKLL